CLMQYKKYSLRKACQVLLQQELKEVKGDIGFIAVDARGNICMEFNAERMHRGYMVEGKTFTAVYQK
ncbi:MAG: beta-aspartyl-peptidase, partial [Chitinophagaceae bacterium]